MTIEGAFIIEALFWRINFKTSQHLMIENSLQSRVSVIAWFCNQLFWVSEVTVPYKCSRSNICDHTLRQKQKNRLNACYERCQWMPRYTSHYFPVFFRRKREQSNVCSKMSCNSQTANQFEFSGSCFFTSGPSLVYDYAVIDWSWLGNCVTIFNRWKMCMRMHENCPRYKNWDKMVFINNLCWLVSF